MFNVIMVSDQYPYNNPKNNIQFIIKICNIYLCGRKGDATVCVSVDDDGCPLIEVLLYLVDHLPSISFKSFPVSSYVTFS